MSRELDIRINAAAEIGFVIWEAGAIVAAVRSAAEVADWVERRLRELPGEREREASDEAETRQTLPRIVASTEKARSRWRVS